MASYTRGLHELGNGIYAYLQPDGSFGWSNAGLVTDAGESLLVDTLFDLRLTAEMLAAMRAADPAAAVIDTLVNSHANGDHTFGNQLVGDARIVTSERAAREMREGHPPQALRAMLANPAMFGSAADYVSALFAPFDLEGIVLVEPTVEFADALTLQVGDKRVELVDVGSAHSHGDVLVHVPADRTVFAADIMFVGSHPIMWGGPAENWIAACDRILGMDVDIVVPGHGPLTDLAGVAEFRAYLVYVLEQATDLFRRGVPAFEAAMAVDLAPYDTWDLPERIVVTVDSIYRHLADDEEASDAVVLFGEMAAFARRRRRDRR